MSKVKILALVVLVALMSSLFAACAAPAPAPAPAPSPAPAPAPAPTPSPAPAPAPAPTPSPAPAPAPAQPAEVFKWEYQTLHPVGSATYPGFHAKLCDRVREMSGGRLDITLHPGNEIVPTYEQTEAVRDGILHMVHSDLGGDMALVGKKALLLGASGYPAGTMVDEDFAWFYLGDGFELAKNVFKDYGVVVGLLSEGQELFCHSHKPLATAADLDGIKFRTIGLWAEVLGSFGASVVTISGGEVYQAAEKGVIDAFEYAGPTVNWPMGFHEIMEYVGVPGIHSPTASHPIQVNPQAWNELPGDLQQILMAAIERQSYEWSTELLVTDSASLQKYRDYGTEIFTVSDELQAEIAKRSLDITMKYVAEEPGFKEIWENKKAFVKTYKEGKAATKLKYSIYD